MEVGGELEEAVKLGLVGDMEMGWGVFCWWVLLGVIGVWSLGKLRERKDDKEKRETKKRAVPRGRLGWPLIGETLDFIASGCSSRPVSFMDNRKSQYGKVFKTHILGRPIIVSTDPEVNKVVLQNQGNTFVPYYPKTVNELLGESSILQINGSQQRKVHALIGGFMRSPQLKSRITRDIQNSVKLSLSTWTHKQLRFVYVQEETKMVTFEILVKVLMSIEPGDDLKVLKREYSEFIKGLICLPVKFPGTTLYKALKAKERLLAVVRRVVEEKKAALEKTGEKWTAMDAVDVLLRDTWESSEANQRMPYDFISGNIIEMMIPGEDSVPNVMTLAVKFLSDSPVALARLREENMELKRQKAQSGDEYTWMDYTSLPFTQNVINETLRMSNIINGVWRKALKDVEIKGYLIPKEWCVLASFISVHMDEENYQNPYEFDPWRWEKTGAAVNGNTFTPFGGGQRLCPGLELSRLEVSIFLHHLVTTYQWVAEKDDIINFPTVKMRGKLPVTVTPIG